MQLREFKEYLRRIVDTYTIKPTRHAQQQMYLRSVLEEDIENNLKHPDKLITVDQEAPTVYRCYFKHSRRYAHIYILDIDETNQKIKVITVIRDSTKWQRFINARSLNRK